MPISVKRFTCRHCGAKLTRVVSLSNGRRYWIHAHGVKADHDPEPEANGNATTEATGKESR